MMRIMRKTVLKGLLLGFGLLMGSSAVALTLGDLVVQSRPGQPLRGIIPMTLDEGESLAQIRAELAGADVYAERQQARPRFLEGMRFALLDMGEKRARLQLYGENPWRGEEAMLLLQLTWPGGLVSQPFRLAAVTPVAESPDDAPRYVEVGDNETLDAIAMRLSRGSNRSYLYMMYALFKNNPDGFYNGDMNNLRRGARLRVPTEAELYRLSDAEVFGGIRSQYAMRHEQDPVTADSAGATAATAPSGEVSPEALQAQLELLANENEATRQRNEDLKVRLARLERQMQQMTQKVLDYPVESRAEPTAEAPEPQEEPTTEPMQRQSPAAQQPSTDSLPSYLLPLLILFAFGAGILVWRNAVRRRRVR